MTTIETLQTINGIDVLALLVGLALGWAAARWHYRDRLNARYWYRLGLRHGHEDKQTVTTLAKRALAGRTIVRD